MAAEEKHRHVCAHCSQQYECEDPEDADLYMGVCALCTAAEAAAEKQRSKKKGRERR